MEEQAVSGWVSLEGWDTFCATCLLAKSDVSLKNLQSSVMPVYACLGHLLARLLYAYIRLAGKHFLLQC